MKFGHSASSENGGVNGAKGDQTGYEVRTQTTLPCSYNVVLRPKSSILAEKSAKACEAGCANNNIGYGQNDRNTLHSLLKANGYNMAAVGLCNCDCSSFMTACAIAGGAVSLEYTGNAPTTSTMRNAFGRSGYYDVLTDAAYTSNQNYLKRGDICVKEGSHTFMILSNGASVGGATASSSSASTTNTTTTSTAGCYPKYTGTSKAIDTVLAAIGADKDYDMTKSAKWQRRIPVAMAQGISGYEGTAAQNNAIISAACAGTLKKVGTKTTATAAAKQTTTASTSTTSIGKYVVGKTYTLLCNVNVRSGAGTKYSLVGYANLTADGKKNATSAGALKKGTVITCKAVAKDSSGNIWVKCPSGWLAAVYSGETYIK